jgi:NADH-quinone oxidoreductase subunit M
MLSAIGLNLLIFLPLVAAVVVWVLPERRTSLAPRISLYVGAAVLAIALALWLQLPGAEAPGSGTARLVGESQAEWVAVGQRVALPGGGTELQNGVLLSYHVGLDAISMPLVVLTALLVPLSVWCSFSSIRTRTREYYAWLLALTAGMFGVFAARDVLLFYVFFEFTLVPLYFLIGIWGGPERRYAANKFFIYTFVGSVITFAGIMYLAIRAAYIDHQTVVDFDLVRLSRLALGSGGLTAAEQWWLFIAFFCGFAIKVPFFPLHTWLPLAHTEAPTAGSVLLAGVLLKLGTYGFLRFSLPMVPEGALAWTGAMGVLAVAGIIYGALCCWVQRDVKKLVAYSSVSHLGFCMLGMFALTATGLSGSVLYMVNHGISTGALFLVVGMIYERYHTRDMTRLSGLSRRMPVWAFFMVFFVLSSVGLPGLNGFVGEFLCLIGAFTASRDALAYPGVLGPWYAAIAAIGMVFAAMYLLIMVGKVVFGPFKEPAEGEEHHSVLPADLTWREIGVLTPLAVVCLYIGFQPAVFTDAMDPAIQQTLAVYPDKVNAVRMVEAAQPADKAAMRLTLLEQSPAEQKGHGDG